MKKNDHDVSMFRYLLGEATEEEQLRLEEQFFADEERYQQLLALEDELRYEYAQGSLPAWQREEFERRFLATVEERQKVALAREILAGVGKAFEETSATLVPVRGKRSIWSQLASFFTMSASGMRLSLTAATLLVLLGGSWLVFQSFQLRHRIVELEAERTSQEQRASQEVAGQRAQQERLHQEVERERNRNAELKQELAKWHTPASFLSFIVSPGLTRDAEGPKQLVIPPNTGSVRLQLDLKGKGEYQTYRAEVQTVKGEQIWSQDSRQATLIIPAHLFASGDYVVSLEGIDAHGDSEEVGDYYFRVVGR